MAHSPIVIPFFSCYEAWDPIVQFGLFVQSRKNRSHIDSQGYRHESSHPKCTIFVGDDFLKTITHTDPPWSRYGTPSLQPMHQPPTLESGSRSDPETPPASQIEAHASWPTVETQKIESP